jgi:glycosyltransferase involved in cell wall biosynthesis
MPADLDLCLFVREDGMKLLALVEAPDHVCCRYRIRAFDRALEQAGCSLSCEGLDRGAVFRTIQLQRARSFDAVILQRKLLASWQLKALRRASRRLVFDFDDAVMFRDSYSQRGGNSRAKTRRFAQIVCAADTIIAGNDFLADAALRAGASVERVHVIPTCVDPLLYPIAQPEGPLELVWIGSSSTLQGLEQSRPIWQRVAEAMPGVKLRVICDRFPESFPLPIVPVPWDEQTEAREIAAGHIGISWIPDDLWSRGKCGLKVLQYQAAGLPVVANPVGAHREMIRDGETGFLATTALEWADALARLAADGPLRLALGRQARRQVEASYSVSAWADTFVTSATGMSALPSGACWKIDRGPGPIERRKGLEPHLARTRPLRTFNQIGD